VKITDGIEEMMIWFNQTELSVMWSILTFFSPMTLLNEI